jgi:uncharacterized coiled-coil protein SlyX
MEVSEFVKEFKAVTDALERILTLESNLHQQLSKAEGSQRSETAEELSNAVVAHAALVDRRRNLLKSVNPSRKDKP